MALNDAPLGKSSDYPDRYAPELLFPVPRDDNRRRIGLADGRWPWFGEDVWQGWELSWLQPSGIPRVVWAEFRLPAASPWLIESKSFKLYLNSLNQETYSSDDQVRDLLVADLSSACGASVTVTLFEVTEPVVATGQPEGYQVIDQEPVKARGYGYDPELLKAHGDTVTEQLCSHLLKSNCPVTGQPDWGTLLIDYTGPRLDRGALLQYVVAFRQKQDFHEHCVETVFTDLMSRFPFESLTVCARYTRRGGLDINPWRSSNAGAAPRVRLVRQ